HEANLPARRPAHHLLVERREVGPPVGADEEQLAVEDHALALQRLAERPQLRQLDRELIAAPRDDPQLALVDVDDAAPAVVLDLVEPALVLLRRRQRARIEQHGAKGRQRGHRMSLLHSRRVSNYDEVYARSLATPEAFWADAARAIDWLRP